MIQTNGGLNAESALIQAQKFIEEITRAIRWGQASAAKEILLEGDAPEKTIELTCNALNFADGMIQAGFKRRGVQPACRKGCSFCCHLLVSTSAPEVLAIAQYVRERFTDEEQAALLQRIDAVIEATAGMTRDERMDCKVPCPLLQNGECSIYEVRPIACRAWHSFDVVQCEMDFHSPAGKGVQVDTSVLLSGHAVLEGLEIAVRHQRYDSRELELVHGLKVALQDPSLLHNWRSRPDAFDAAVEPKLYPDAKRDRTSEKIMQQYYREVTNRPEWSEIKAGYTAERNGLAEK
jgi:hypothetical protein